ncbi:unnamed protein product, partial [Laminaria digitata]
QNGGVFWTKGNISIVGGTFSDNESPALGGVFYALETSVVAVKGGMFEHNMAQDGAVGVVDKDSTLRVENGTYTGNVAERQGGVFTAFGGG